MYNKLRNALETPAAHTPSDAGIWTDAHISAQMLAAHLDPAFEGASRKHSFIDASTNWISGLLPPAAYPTLLDVGCGPGLYAQRFAQKGYRVTGIDFSGRSIQYATAQAQNVGLTIRYLQQDYLHMETKESFRLAAFIYCDYGALSPQNRRVILQNIYQSLETGGRLILDVFSMCQYAAFEEGRTWDSCPGGGFWSEEEYLAFNSACRYAQNLTLRQTILFTKADVRRFYLWDTYFTPEALAREAEQAGFSVCGVFADVCGTPYTQDSPTIAILLKKG